MAVTLSAVVLLSGCRKSPDRPVYNVPLGAPGPTRFQAALTTTIPSRLGHLNAVAVDKSGRIFAVGAGGINILDAKGDLIANWLKPENLRCVALADDGKVYVASPTRIIKLDPDGRELVSWNTVGPAGPRLGRVTSLAVRSIELLAADADARCIHRFTTDGDFSNNIPMNRDPGKPSGGLVVPSPHLDCAFDAAGNVVISHPGKLRVETYSLDGKLLSAWGESGMEADHFCGCCNPTDIALAPDGNVVTAEKGVFRVKLYDPAGRMLAFIAPGNFSRSLVGSDMALDLAVDAKGLIYVADPGDGKIRVFTLMTENR